MKETSDIWMIGPDQLQKSLKIERSEQGLETDQQDLAYLVNFMSMDQFQPIHCDEINSEMRDVFNQFVYFGPQDDVLSGGKAAHLQDLALRDLYTVEEENYGFYFNEDRECLKRHRLEEEALIDELTYVGLFNGEKIKPSTYPFANDYSMVSVLFKEAIMHSVFGSPYWNKRIELAME